MPMIDTEKNVLTESKPEEANAIERLAQKTEVTRDSILAKSYRSVMIGLLVLALILAIGVIFLALGWSNAQGVVTHEVDVVEIEKIVEVPAFTVIDPRNEYSHETSPDSYLLSDTNYGPIWMPALASVKRNEYNNELFIKDEETGYITYDDGTYKTVAGIDISKYQNNVDWDAVKDSGFEFVIIRCAYRGYVTGSLNADEAFDENIKGALKAGLKVGVYVFSQAMDVEEALEEAEFVIDLIKDYKIEYPVVYDWEVVIDDDGDTARTKYITPDQLTNNALVFCERIALEGYTPMVYANKKTAVWKYDLSRMNHIDIWFAEYSDTPSYFYDFAMWQYSSKGSVPGIKGNVDLNISFKDYSGE